MKIRPGCIVELDYELRDGEGQVFESSKEEGRMRYLHGNEEIPAGIEGRLEGAQEGDKMEIALAAGEAYGQYDPEGILSIPRENFPPDAEIVPGDWIEVTVQHETEEEEEEEEGEEDEEDEDEEPDTHVMEMRVLEISPEAIVLDANHPLAGKPVVFDLEVISVRQASAEEIAERTEVEGEEEEEEEEEE